MSEPTLSWDDLQNLRKLAVENGDEYLLAAVNDAIFYRGEMARLAGELFRLQVQERDRLLDFGRWIDGPGRFFESLEEATDYFLRDAT